MQPVTTAPDVADPSAHLSGTRTDAPTAEETSADPAQLKEAVAVWAEAHYAPLDVAALDAPAVCVRCRLPITPDDPIDYLVGDDDSMSVVHETCPGPPPTGAG